MCDSSSAFSIGCRLRASYARIREIPGLPNRSSERRPTSSGVPKTLEPHLVAAYDRAYAALLIPGKPISSVNQVKWRHWTHHLRRRRAAADLLDLASWVVPMGGQIPVHHQEQRVEIAIVKFGGRRWDRANFVAACKELVDELVARHLIKDDTETWLEDAYYQVPGGVVGRVEVLFLRPMLAKTG